VLELSLSELVELDSEEHFKYFTFCLWDELELESEEELCAWMFDSVIFALCLYWLLSEKDKMTPEFTVFVNTNEALSKLLLDFTLVWNSLIWA